MSGEIVTAVFESALHRTLKPLAAVYATFAKPDGTSVFPSIARVAWLLDVQERHVRRYVSQLRSLGVLQLTAPPAPRRPTRYFFDVTALPQRSPFVARQLKLEFSTVSAGKQRTSGVERRSCTSSDPSVDPSVVNSMKSSRADARLDFSQVKPISVKAQIATPQLLAKVVHTLLAEQPALVDDLGGLVDAMKWRLARLDLAVTEDGMGASARIGSAVESALYQHQHVVHGGTPWWKVKQQQDRARRRAGR